jgi:hypothetical protein
MTKLNGELIATPSPNHPGNWAYRMLADGTLLETQLTREEWRELHAKALAKSSAKLHARVFNHPLNQAALKLLEKVGVRPQDARQDQVMPVLQLPLSLLDDQDQRIPVLSDYARSLKLQWAALQLLRHLTPDELLAGSPQEAAEAVANELQMSDPKDPSTLKLA